MPWAAGITEPQGCRTQSCSKGKKSPHMGAKVQDDTWEAKGNLWHAACKFGTCTLSPRNLYWTHHQISVPHRELSMPGNCHKSLLKVTLADMGSLEKTNMCSGLLMQESCYQLFFRRISPTKYFARRLICLRAVKLLESDFNHIPVQYMRPKQCCLTSPDPPGHVAGWW